MVVGSSAGVALWMNDPGRVVSSMRLPLAPFPLGNTPPIRVCTARGTAGRLAGWGFAGPVAWLPLGARPIAHAERFDT